jgi:hypothetical protein
MENVPVVDQPKWPALDALGTPAIMSFRMIWKATDEKIVYDDPYSDNPRLASPPPTTNYFTGV